MKHRGLWRAGTALVLSGALGTWTSSALAQALALPDTPAGAETRAYLEALNSGDAGKAAAFINDHFPTSPREAEDFAAFQNQVGGFDLVRVETATQTQLTALLREHYGAYARLEIEVDAAAPHHITAVRLRPEPEPPGLAPTPRLDDAALAKAIAAQMTLLGDNFSGAVLVTRGDKVVFSAAQGLADRERNQPNTLQTRFRVGSMDKMFTATAIMQLVQAGKLDLQAPLATYLKNYPNAELARKVTLRHLLTHTGGTGDIFEPEYEAKRDQVRTLKDYVDLFGARPLGFEPDAKWEYSNYGFILLGRVIEVVSGQSFYDYVQEHVFKPAGMTATGFEPESIAVPDRAAPYMKGSASYERANELPWRGTSAGGGYSTAGDFQRFATALFDGRLLDTEHRRQMLTGRIENQPGMKYGYGFGVYVEANPVMVGHNGVDDGQNGDLRIIGENQGMIVALSNVTPPRQAGPLAKFISDRFQAE
jgi:CubicO group peptidase (beta-lactamase class C family)